MTAPAGRDRDAAGRARNARPRDELGRPLPKSAAQDVPRIPDDLVVTPAEAADLGGRLLAEGRPFHAHEVFEAAWKSAAGAGTRAVARPRPDRGGAHPRAGAATRAARWRCCAGAPATSPRSRARQGEVDAGFVAAQAAGLALRIERDGLGGIAEADLRLALRPGGSKPPAQSQLAGSADPGTSVLWLAPACASAATSAAVSANPVSAVSTAAANTTPYTVPDGLSSGPPELPGSTSALIS